jgi:hypothetical protein
VPSFDPVPDPAAGSGFEPLGPELRDPPPSPPPFHQLAPQPGAADRPPPVQNMVAIDFGTSTTTVAASSDVDLKDRGFAGPRRDDLLEALRALVAERPDVRNTAAALLTGDGRTASLDDALTSTSIDTPRLDALMAALERFAGNSGDPDLWIALQRCYRAFFTARPFETLGIWPVELGIAGDAVELPSAVGELDPAPPGRPRRKVLVGTAYEGALDDLAAYPEPAGTSADELAALTVHRGLKRQIGLSSGAHAEGLVVELLGRLKDEVQEQFRKSERYASPSPEPLPLRRAVLTYPTVAHPGRRRRLLEIAKDAGIEEVVGQYDEAVAAAIAYLAKAMRSNFEIGFEHFLSRCRPHGRNRWEHTALVVDVGGGTTDVALLAIDVVDHTAEHLSDGDDEGAWGRLYKVTPTVLGSTGALFQGGDRLTLDLFRYRKAADALSGGDLRELRDAQDYVDRICSIENRHHADHRRLIEDVDQLVATRWAHVTDREERLRRQAEFHRRWNRAEKDKIDYARGKLRGSEDEHWFLDHIVGRFGEAVATTATEVVERTFGIDAGEPSDERRIDAVVLSGKSSDFAAVRDRLVDRLRKYGVDHSRVESYGGDVANKQAASLGACYAQHLDETGFRNPGANLRRGTWQLDLEVQNLRFNLPAQFGVTLQKGAQREHDWVFGHAGRREFRPLDADQAEHGLGYVRSEWLDTQPSIQLHRGAKESIPWGSWDLMAALGAVDYARLGPSLRCQFEIDLDLSVRLYLANGRPAFDLRDLRPARTLELPVAAGIEPPAGRVVGLDAEKALIPRVSVVLGQSASSGNDWTADVAEPGARFLHTVKLDDGHGGAGEDDGGLLDALLITLDPSVHSVTRGGGLRLCFGFPGVDAETFTVQAPPVGRLHEVDQRYRPLAHLVVVEDGRVFYLPGAPPYWAADVPGDLATPGRVWRVEATPPPDEPEMTLHDPFNGTH